MLAVKRGCTHLRRAVTARRVRVAVACAGSAAPKRGIASGCTNGIDWYNTSVHSSIRPVSSGEAWAAVALGTSSSQPTRVRNVSCALLRAHMHTFMFDCGEGAMMRLRDCFLSAATSVHRIFITHLHGDHVFGLPSVLAHILDADRQAFSQTSSPRGGEAAATTLTVGNAHRLQVYGPVGLHAFLTAAFCTLPRRVLRRFPVDVHELVPPAEWAHTMDSHRRAAALAGAPPPQQGFGTLHYLHADAAGVYTCMQGKDGMTVRAAPLSHTVPCYGYVVQEADHMHMVPERVRARGIHPGPIYKELKAGRAIQAPDGSWVRPEDVMERGSRGRKVVILGDNSDASVILPLAQGADLVLHEATIHDGDEAKARDRGHSTPSMAGKFAAAAHAERLLLTHFSPGFHASPVDACIHQFGSHEVEAAMYAHGRSTATSGQTQRVSQTRNVAGTPAPRTSRSPSPLHSRDTVDAAALSTSRRHASTATDDATEAANGAVSSAYTVAGGGTHVSHSILETSRMVMVGDRPAPAHTTVAANARDAAASIARGRPQARGVMFVSSFAHPAVRETPGMAGLVAQAQATFGCPRVMTARDFVAVPIARSPWTGEAGAKMTSE